MQHNRHFGIRQHAGYAQNATQRRLRGGPRHGGSRLDVHVAGIQVEKAIALSETIPIGVGLQTLSRTIILGRELIVVIQNPLQTEFFEVSLIHFNETGFDFNLIRNDIDALQNSLKRFQIVGGVGNNQLADRRVVRDGRARRELNTGLFKEGLHIGLGHIDTSTHGDKFLRAFTSAGIVALNDDIHERRLDGIHAGNDLSNRGIYRRNHNGGIFNAEF